MHRSLALPVFTTLTDRMACTRQWASYGPLAGGWSVCLAIDAGGIDQVSGWLAAFLSMALAASSAQLRFAGQES